MKRIKQVTINQVTMMVLFLLTIAPVLAQEELGTTREIELGALMTSGNTEEESLNFAGLINVLQESREYTFTLDGLYTSTDGKVKGQRIYGVAQADFEINEYSYFQSRLAHEDDRFSGFDGQSDLTFGYGRELLRGRDNMTLEGEVGVGARYSRLETGEETTEPIIRLAGDYEWAFSETAVFTQRLSLDKGSDSDIWRSTTSLETNIMSNLSLRLSFRIKHQTEVPLGKKKTDSESAVTLVMSF